MKKLVLLSAIAMSGLFYNTADAQFRVHLGVNLVPNRVVVAPGAEAPVYADAVYNNDDYYYLPDVDAYYNISQQCYYYFDGDNWTSAAFLPGEYHDFDWRNARRYEVREPHPYLRNDFYVNRYKGNEYAFKKDSYHGNFDNHADHYGYREPQHFDNDGYGQHFNDNRNNGQNNNPHFQNGWDPNRQPVQNQNYQDQGRNRGNNNNWNNNRGNQQQQGNQDQGRGMLNNGKNNHNNGNQQQQNQGNQSHGGNQQQFAQNQGSHGGEQRVAQNNQQRGGHGGGSWKRF
ncbi:hypothetical protein [Mucilaginibacter sp.]